MATKRFLLIRDISRKVGSLDLARDIIREAESSVLEAMADETPGPSNLRDYFAAAALPGLIAADMPCANNAQTWEQNAAGKAYLLADSMLAARDGGEQ